MKFNLRDRETLILALILIPFVIAGSVLSSLASVSPNTAAVYTQFSNVDKYDYIFFNDGTNYYAKNGTTGEIAYQSVSASIVVQNALNSLGSAGGNVHFKAGTYLVNTTITTPDHPGSAFTITGDGMRNTKILWDHTVTGDYVFNLFSSGWQIVAVKDIQVWGGADSAHKVGMPFKIGRTNSSQVANYLFQNVRVAYSGAEGIEASYVQDSFLYNVAADTNTNWSIKATNATHMNVYGGVIETVTTDDSRFMMIGGTLKALNLDNTPNYATDIIGVVFDPVPAGFGDHLQIGATALVANVNVIGCNFATTVENNSTNMHIDIGTARNVFLQNNHYVAVSPDPGTYIRVNGTASYTTINLEGNIDSIGKISDSGSRTTIYSGSSFRNTISIENPSGTLGSLIIDRFTTNQISLGNSAKNVYLQVKINDASALAGITTRNAANNADMQRVTITNKSDNATINILNSNVNMNGNKFTGLSTGSADPTTSDIASGYWAMWKNTGSGAVKICYNDSGTIKCATLS